MFLGSLRFCGKSIYIAKKCLVFNSQRMKGMGLLFRKCSFLSPLCGFRTGITGLQKVRQCDHGRVHFCRLWAEWVAKEKHRREKEGDLQGNQSIQTLPPHFCRVRRALLPVLCKSHWCGTHSRSLVPSIMGFSTDEMHNVIMYRNSAFFAPGWIFYT